VVSDCGPELPPVLATLAVAALLDVRVFSIEEHRHKPDPRMYLTGCARLSVTPRDCLYVGDGGSRELTGAAAAGLTAVRLAAPDLGSHLVFGFDADWHGAAVESLTDVVPLATGAIPARGARPF
jgi:putative hydrolase of the HAD superfamily